MDAQVTKYRISSDYDNRLDLCANCDETLLDKGQWSLLKPELIQLNLIDRMSTVFAEKWQRQVRQKIIEKNRRQRFFDMLAEETIQRS